jgi:hypothetical protein
MALADDIKNGVARQTCIKFLNSTLPEIKTGFHSGTISLERSICDTQGELVFGGCVASQFKATIEGIDDIAGKRVQVYQVIGDNTVILITGTVASSEISSDKNSRNVIIYDDLYTLRGKNVAEWYNALKFPLSLNSFTRSLLTNMKVSASTSMNLSQSNVQVTKTVNTDALSFGDVIKPICSLCGGFGYMTPEGKFDILYLTNDTVDLTIASGFKAQQFEAKAIDKVQIRSSETDIGGIAGTGTNAYILQGNFICYNKTAEELNAIATTLLNKIQGHPYTPFSGSMIISDPTLDLSKLYNITSASGETSISSYIFSTKFSGIQTFECEIASGGKEERTEVVSDTNTELSIVNNKWLNLTKNVDGLSVEVGKKVDGNTIISSINASPEQIQINSSRVNITGLASFISVGDRNLLLNTKDFSKSKFTNGNWTVSTDDDGFTVASRTGDGRYNSIQVITNVDATDNAQSDKQVVITIDAKADDLLTTPRNYLVACEVYGSNDGFKTQYRAVFTNTYIDGSSNTLKYLAGTRENNKWCTLSYTMTLDKLTSGSWGTYNEYHYGVAVYTHSNNTGHTISVRKFKMSFGNVPSDWSPNPDDISVENIYKDDTTLIDGGKIYTGSVKAQQIDVNNVFAQDIQATGTITGGVFQSPNFEETETNVSGVQLNLTTGDFLAGKITVKGTSDEGVQNNTTLTSYGVAVSGSSTQYSLIDSYGLNIMSNASASEKTYAINVTSNNFFVHNVPIYFNGTEPLLSSSPHTNGHAYYRMNGAQDNLENYRQCAVGVSENANFGLLDIRNSRWVLRNTAQNETTIYGDTINFETYPSATSNLHSKFKPYITIGDTITLNHNLSGYITGSGVSLSFFIPVSCYIAGATNATLKFKLGTSEGVRVRQRGNYIYGSSADTYVNATIKSQTTSINRYSGVNVILTMTSATNAVNNESCGIQIVGSMTFT